jgi:PhnB protein
MSEPEPRAAAGPVREFFAYLCVRGAAEAIAFYSRVFGAREAARLTGPDGRVAHAELELGPVTLMLADEHPEGGFLAPPSLGGTATRFHLHVDDVDLLARRAVEAGATLLREPADQEHGERQCLLRDPFGHEWLLGHEIEALSAEEVRRRLEERYPGSGSPA